MKSIIELNGIKYTLILLAFGLLLFSSSAYSQENNMQNHHINDSTLIQRQEMIHMRSHMVMPFNMNKVTHYFIKNSKGGVLIIKAKDPSDTKQISLIQKHLRKEHKLFSKADFKDPKTLHGIQMPGLKVLTKSKGKFNVDYLKLTDGAQLTFTSKDSKVIKALHTWFDAQLRDHGKDAKSSEPKLKN